MARVLASDPLPAAPAVVTRLIRGVVEDARRSLLDGTWESTDLGARGEQGLSPEALAEAVRRRFAGMTRLRPEPVLNATGILVHTNLGRSPLSEVAVRHLAEIGAGYSDLEYDLALGRRGSRQDNVTELLRLACGVEDALVVNNNAAAVLLMLAALARDRDVVISRGELVEIGGSFRVPEVLAQSGARLREVGTTNRTHLRDYEAAAGPETGLLLKVHTSNYRIEGFTAEVSLEDLVALGRERGIPVAVDLGSGAMLDVAETGMRSEPVVSAVAAMGPDLVTFSGDKMLGGPQAGIVVGRRDAVEKLRRHPLARALRIDKLLLAALQATLVAHLDPARARREIPVLRMLFEPLEAVRARAERLAAAVVAALPGGGPTPDLETVTAAVGGGSLPGEGVPSVAVVVDPRPRTTAARLERALRAGDPPVVGRISGDRLILDVRTLSEDDERLIPALLAAAWDRAIGEEA